MLYIMRRTQLYLPENLWKSLHLRSRQRGTTISQLVREAVGDKYGESHAGRQQAMQALVGLWKDRRDLPDTQSYVRQLRKGRRLKRARP